jgi:hypothetical protein
VSFNVRDFFDRFIAALDANDFETAAAMTHPDFETTMPQSGEKMSGIRAWEAQMAAYPDADKIVAQTLDAQIVGDEDRWAITPSYTVVPLAAGHEYTIVFRTQYPDGSWWRLISIVELQDEKMRRMETFFAPELPAPLAESISTYGRG